MDIFDLVLVVILIALTAFFVVSEFAIVKVRSSRINQLIEEGHPRAMTAKKVIVGLDEYLSACQLGITITALALGWIGEPAVAGLLYPFIELLNIPTSLSHVIAVGAAFTIITFLHVVVGELAPKTLAIQKAEAMTLIVAQPLIFFYKAMYPFIWMLNSSARVIIGLFGLKPVSENDIAHSEEELRIILSESLKSGEINPSEFKYVNKIFEFDERIAKEIMVPRTEMVTLSKDESIDSLIDAVCEERFTRYPIIDGDKDHIIGLINFKEVLTDYVKNKETGQLQLEQYVRPTIRVIDSIPIHELLVKLQKARIHMAILMDEYGGTSGLVTIEDILEEIVGEIQDEFDLDEIPLVQKVNESHFIMDGKVLISEINNLLNLDMKDEDIDTIGGWILTENYEAAQGDIIEYNGYFFLIKEMEDRQIKYVEIRKKPQVSEDSLTKQPSLPLAESKALS